MCRLLSGRGGNRAGFTLIEALIVVVYIALIASIVIPRMTGATRKAKEANMRATLKEIRKAVGSFQAETGLFPASLADIVANAAPPTGLDRNGNPVAIIPADFRGPYLKVPGTGLPKDAITGAPNWTYTTTPPVGQVHSAAPGNSLEEGPYSLF